LNEGGDIHLLGNGIQIFPGSVPIYRGSTLIGGIGVSGDGVDQDDMIAFLSVHRVGEALGTLGNAPKEIRADTIEVENVRLRYISCPFNPFLDESEQQVCNGK
ncbi:MAG: heme-binding protein, partial [Gammaproteobacteria bacterium]|nr:heme-binding protein [Gammaproteobacteria bacterium]